MHSLAALQMPFDLQVEVTAIQSFDVVQHPCHQDVANTLNDDDLPMTQATACNVCILCMAFGFPLLHLVVIPSRFSIISNISKKISFVSYDTPALRKPPIL